MGRRRVSPFAQRDADSLPHTRLRSAESDAHLRICRRLPRAALASRLLIRVLPSLVCARFADWMLFGHALHNRLEKGEDVMFFAFDMLQYITHTKFSLQTAVDNRHKRRIVEAELHIERSASPMPVVKEQKPIVPPAAAAVVAEAPVKRTSALTSALQQQGPSAPALRKSSSDGSGAMDPRTATLREAGGSAALATSDDEGQSSLLVDGPGSFSPAANLHALPPVSSSFTAAKPSPSLSTFIIDEHGSGSQAHAGDTPASSAALSAALPAASASTTPAASDSSSVSTAASASPAASAEGEEDESHSPYVPSTAPTAAIAIPVRKGSSGASVAQQQASSQQADATLSTSGSGNVSLASATASAAASGSVVSGSHMSRVNSWTLLNDKSTPPTASAMLASHKATPSKDASAVSSSSLQLPSQNGSKSTPVRDASSSSSSSSASASAAAAARAASARRCDRLLEVRSLFMTIWHYSLPSTTPAATAPHAHATSYACAQKAAAARTQPSVKLHDGASLSSELQNGAATGEVQPAVAASANGSKASPPVAAAATKGTQAPAASSWFSS